MSFSDVALCIGTWALAGGAVFSAMWGTIYAVFLMTILPLPAIPWQYAFLAGALCCGSAAARGLWEGN